MGWVYRCFGHDGSLLYVGSTVRPAGERLAEHARDKPWWPEVSRCDVQPVPDAVLLRVEAAAIRSQRPRYNVVHNRRNPHRVTTARRPGRYPRPYRPERVSRRYAAPVTPGVWWPALGVVAGLMILGCGTGAGMLGGAALLIGGSLLGLAVQVVRRGRLRR